ncbi:hypothetical protein PtA15_5A95 [Puccinia triticina]|uniref:Uncharacterized protein n=1 Tax=Puccinia triticina TaxID=208348 RepID=A0ABY7CIE6_9BASI|nr:uncharacterized protein PtA15_5A95 [Puccinia triticina]WAQ84525.1 hypothetical protein PtA15_5A95 [Puccinia triticina]WAR57866.1 hypothetical protein PtB15_5B96 [Puccinia triticina]
MSWGCGQAPAWAEGWVSTLGDDDGLAVHVHGRAARFSRLPIQMIARACGRPNNTRRGTGAPPAEHARGSVWESGALLPTHALEGAHVPQRKPVASATAFPRGGCGGPREPSRPAAHIAEASARRARRPSSLLLIALGYAGTPASLQLRRDGPASLLML